MMLEMVEEPNTLRLFRDLFTIFYEPLVRVYKSANSTTASQTLHASQTTRSRPSQKRNGNM